MVRPTRRLERLRWLRARVDEHIAVEEQRLEEERAAAEAAAQLMARSQDTSAPNIRRWAAANGYTVAPRGRIPAEVREAYLEAVQR